MHEVEAQGLLVRHVKVVAICEVSGILPAVSEREFLVVFGTVTGRCTGAGRAGLGLGWD